MKKTGLLSAVSVIHGWRTACIQAVLEFNIRALRPVVCLCLATLLSCGGGGGLVASLTAPGGVGSGGTGIVEGLIAGFGSVIIDGVEYDDSAAVSQTEDEEGKYSPTQTKLGQRVTLTQSQAGVATIINVVPLLRGPINASLQGNYFQVMHQWVQVLPQSTASGNATVLDGLANLNALQSSAMVQVYGVWVFDVNKNAHVLQASRIELLSTPPTYYLVSGLVMGRSNNDLQINQPSIAPQIHPLNALPQSIALGSLVRAWVQAATLGSASGNVFQASRVVDATPATSNGQTLLISVPAQASNVQNGQLQTQGLNLQIPPALAAQMPQSSSLVQLSVLNTNGVLTVMKVNTPSNTPALQAQVGGQVEIKGAIPWIANPPTINMRGSLVVGTNAPGVINQTCPAQNEPNPVQVNIIANLGPPGSPLVAQSVTCTLAPKPQSVIQQSGYLLSYTKDLSTLTFSIAGSPVPMTLIAGTVLPPPPNDLPNLVKNKTPLTIQYQVINSVNQIRDFQPAPPN